MPPSTVTYLSQHLNNTIEPSPQARRFWLHSLMVWDFCLAVKMLVFNRRGVHCRQVLPLLVIQLIISSTASASTTVPDDFFYHNFLRRNESKEGMNNTCCCDQDITLKGSIWCEVHFWLVCECASCFPCNELSTWLVSLNKTKQRKWIEGWTPPVLTPATTQFFTFQKW